MKEFNHTPNPGCPCKGCLPPTRTSTCHSTCQLYVDWDKDHKRKLAKEKFEREIASVCRDGSARRNKQLTQKGVTFGRGKNRNGSG